MRHPTIIDAANALVYVLAQSPDNHHESHAEALRRELLRCVVNATAELIWQHGRAEDDIREILLRAFGPAVDCSREVADALDIARDVVSQTA